MQPSTGLARSLDGAAIGMSAACVIHCLALPLMVSVLPILGPFAASEIAHKALVLVAVPISAAAIMRGWTQDGAWIPTTLIILGLGLLLAAAFAEPLHDHETPLTVFGALILAAGHLLRWRRHQTHFDHSGELK
ncbi:MAG: MerC domain-containing protein [Pseudomonadota bacterium]